MTVYVCTFGLYELLLTSFKKSLNARSVHPILQSPSINDVCVYTFGFNPFPTISSSTWNACLT
uniref:Uncharacterized protein n=1 Tax=Arundo donax TaxID=35708 RepID=A0A0A9DAN0_ARUDO